MNSVDIPFSYSCRKYIGQIWTDSLVHDEKALKYLLEVIGKVLFGAL